MRKVLMLAVLLFVGALASAQIYPYPATRVTRGDGAPSGAACATAADVGKVYLNQTAAAAGASFYTCDNTGVATYAWELAGGGGSVAFSSITAGTSTAALVIGAGGSLSVSGTGIIAATSTSGIVGLATRSGTTDTLANSDGGKLIRYTNSAAIAVTLPQAGASFPAGWFVDIMNSSTSSNGVVTITPTTSTIDGAATYVLNPKMGIRIISDGTNYFVWRPGTLAYLAGFTPTTQQYAVFQATTTNGPTLANGFLSYTGNGQTISSTAFVGAITRVVSFSATPTFDLSSGNRFKITLTNNVTSSTFSNPTDGQEVTMDICQDGTGSRTFAFPAAFKGVTIPPAAAVLNTCSVQTWFYDGGSTSYYAYSIGGLNQ